MYECPCILFYEPLTPKTYLEQVLRNYPYDISPSLVYTLLTHDPFPHPALLTFIDFIRHTQKYMVCENHLQEPCLDQLFAIMCTLSQRNCAVLHTHQFHMDALFHISHFPIYQPYANLPLHEISLIDAIHMNQSVIINQRAYNLSTPIQFSHNFPFSQISLNSSAFFAISIQIHHVNGLIFLPREDSALLIAISSLYQIATPKTHPDFFLIYGVKQPEDEHTLYFDQTNHLYVGCFCKATYDDSFQDCVKMIQSLYSMISLENHDLTISASMVTLQINHQLFGLLLCGEEHSGKSELLDAFLTQCEQAELDIIKVFENYGTLHLLDETLAATGTQIGASIHAQALPRARIYEKLSSSVLVKEDHMISYFLTPFTTYEETCQFHAIQMICCMNKQTDQHRHQDFTVLDDPEAALPHFLSLSPLYDSAQISHIQKLWENIVNTIFLKNIPILQIPIKPSSRHTSKYYDRIAKKLLKGIIRGSTGKEFSLHNTQREDSDLE